MESFGFQWHITNRCNLRCKHCYQNSFGADSESSLDGLKELADRILGENQQRQVSVTITGGEPFLFSHLIDLLEHLHTFNNLLEVQLITNGTIADRDLLQSLGRLPKLIAIKISIESGEAETNDSIRGTGTFQKISSHIKYYRKWTQKSITLMMTLSRHNMESLENMIHFARETGVSGIILERFVPLGRGLEMKAAALTPADWQKALHTIVEQAQLDMDPLCLLPYHAFHLTTDQLQPEKIRGALCNLGCRSMALMPDGTVFPCRRLPLTVGNLFLEPFSLIQKRLAHYHMDAIRGRLIGSTCGRCGITDCVGCRAMAQAVSNNMLQDDPSCPLLLV